MLSQNFTSEEDGLLKDMLEQELNAAMKKVQRLKRKEQEEEEWSRFIKKINSFEEKSRSVASPESAKTFVVANDGVWENEDAIQKFDRREGSHYRKKAYSEKDGLRGSNKRPKQKSTYVQTTISEEISSQKTDIPSKSSDLAKEKSTSTASRRVSYSNRKEAAGNQARSITSRLCQQIDTFSKLTHPLSQKSISPIDLSDDSDKESMKILKAPPSYQTDSVSYSSVKFNKPSTISWEEDDILKKASAVEESISQLKLQKPPTLIWEEADTLEETVSHVSTKPDSQASALKLKNSKDSVNSVSRRADLESNIAAKGTRSIVRVNIPRAIVPLSQLRVLNNRLVMVMSNIYTLIDMYEEVQDDEDYVKKRNQAFAFSSRLTGNHLYNLNKLVKEIEKLPVSSSFMNEQQLGGLKQKLRSAYQCALSASQMCERYLQSGKLFLVADKILEMLKLILELLYSSKKKTVDTHLDNMIESSELHIKIESILKLIEFRIAESRAAEAQKVTSQVWNKTPATVRQNVKPKKKSGQPQRLSMYAQNRMRKNVRRPFRKPPQPLQNTDMDPPATSSRNLASSLPGNAVTGQKSSDFGSGVSVKISKEPSLKSIFAPTLRSTSSNKISSHQSASHASSVEKQICGEGSVGTSRSRQLSHTKSNTSIKEPPTQGSSKVVNALRSRREGSLSTLLYTEKSPQPEVGEDQKCPTNVGFTSIVNNDINETPEEQNQNSATSITEEEFESIMQYRNRCENFRGQSPLYSVDEYPWESLEEISETLCNEILVQVTSKLELDSIIRRIYDLEFS